MIRVQSVFHRFFLVLAISILCEVGSASNDSALRVEVLLSPQMLRQMHISPAFVSAIDITPSRNVLIASTDQFYLLGWGGITPMGQKTGFSVNDFVYTQDSLLMVIRGKELCYLSQQGKLELLYQLPAANMGICRGKRVMYLFNRENQYNRNAIYLLAAGGSYIKILELPSPVESLIEMDDALIFASGNAVMRYDLSTKKLSGIAKMGQNFHLQSVTADPETKRIFFSTSGMICTIDAGNVRVITNEFGGELTYFNGLIIFDTQRSLLMRLTGIEAELAKKATPALQNVPAILTNENIIDFVKSGISDSQIIATIQQGKGRFDLSVDGMISLAEQRVSSAVIMEMKKAMKK